MKNILIVDDKEQDLYLLRKILEGHGYVVVSASNGKDALKLALKSPPDIIISDIMMPVMDGFILCREWMGDERLQNTPFVFYTATYTDAEDEEFALSLGAARFIVKPTEPDELIKIIQGVFRELDEGKIKPRTPMPESDKQALKLYDERLVRKLEKKNMDLDKEVAARKRAEKEMNKAFQELGAKHERLERIQRLSVGRELEMVKLKEEVNSLLEKLGLLKKYEAPDIIGKKNS